MTDPVFWLIAAVLQVIGYLLYIRGFLRKSIRPNAASYLMFAYGTSLVAFLAWESGATWQELVLPVVCAMMSIIVAMLCFRKGATDSIDRFEAIIFSADVVLTVAYVTLVLTQIHTIGHAVLFLVLGNITTFTSFLPIVRSTWRSPQREQPLPWLVWTTAYATLTVSTLISNGLTNPVLLFYPLINVMLHGSIAALASRKPFHEMRFVNGDRSIFVGRSAIHCDGVFAGREYREGHVVWQMTGRIHSNLVTENFPNFVGIGPNTWMNPDSPIDRLNHSCTPNVAFNRKRLLYALRDITEGEEITIDYSTTEVDPHWSMECDCKKPNCRQVLHAIHLSFAECDEPPPASPLMQRVWRKRRVERVNFS